MRIARRGARVYPCQHGGNLLRRERRIVGEVPEARVGKPRRHHSALNRFRDSRRPWPRLLVGHQRHGCDFTRTMATLAVVLEEGQDVFIESGSWFCRVRRERQPQPEPRGERKSRPKRTRTPAVYKNEIVMLSAVRLFRRTVDSRDDLYARCFPPKPSRALMICADHCATSSSRSVRSAD